MSDTTTPAGPRIYNLFPLLAGPLPRWLPHLERARQMEFNWLFLNPFQLSGHSGSLYAIKDYYAIDPRLVDPAAGAPETQLRRMIDGARALGLRVMMDLVINHTAFDSPLVAQHPSWYRRGPDGQPIHPGAKEGQKTITWGDLFEIDNTTARRQLYLPLDDNYFCRLPPGLSIDLFDLRFRLLAGMKGPAASRCLTGIIFPPPAGAVARHVELKDGGVMDQAVDGGGGSHWIFEDPLPIAEY
jgi:hypothetical protein